MIIKNLRLFLFFTLLFKLIIIYSFHNINNLYYPIIYIYSIALLLNVILLYPKHINIKYNISLNIIIDLLSGFFIYLNLFEYSDTWLFIPVIISCIYLIWNNNFAKLKIINLLIYFYIIIHILFDIYKKMNNFNKISLIYYSIIILLISSLNLYKRN